MATVQHSTLTSAELHEPKGVATANANTVYIADGAGSGQWRLKPNGYCFYDNGTGTTFTTPTAYTLCNVASGVSGVQREFSHNGAGRLTYTGASQIGVALSATISHSHTGTNASLFFQFYLNGAATGPVSRVGTGTATVDRVTPLKHQLLLSTNDYIELYLRADAGDIVVKSLAIDAEGII